MKGIIFILVALATFGQAISGKGPKKVGSWKSVEIETRDGRRKFTDQELIRHGVVEEAVGTKKLWMWEEHQQMMAKEKAADREHDKVKLIWAKEDKAAEAEEDAKMLKDQRRREEWARRTSEGTMPGNKKISVSAIISDEKPNKLSKRRSKYTKSRQEPLEHRKPDFSRMAHLEIEDLSELAADLNSGIFNDEDLRFRWETLQKERKIRESREGLERQKQIRRDILKRKEEELWQLDARLRLVKDVIQKDTRALDIKRYKEGRLLQLRVELRIDINRDRHALNKDEAKDISKSEKEWAIPPPPPRTFVTDTGKIVKEVVKDPPGMVVNASGTVVIKPKPVVKVVDLDLEKRKKRIRERLEKKMKENAKGREESGKGKSEKWEA